MMNQSKDEKIGTVSYLIIIEKLKFQRDKINVQKLATSAGVSRPWIYKYFGSSEEEMVLNAIDCMAPQLTELSKKDSEPTSPKEWARFFLKSIDKTLQEVEIYPEFFQFYFLSTLFPDEYGKRLIHHEGLFREQKEVPRLKVVFGFSYSEARAFAEMTFTLRMGVVMSWIKEL
jgi:AcrR family transcriptional regulator